MSRFLFYATLLGSLAACASEPTRPWEKNDERAKPDAFQQQKNADPKAPPNMYPTQDYRTNPRPK